MSSKRSTFRGLLVLATLAAANFGCVVACYAEERTFEENGVTYRETRIKSQRPVYETKVEQREQTFYRENIKTEIQSTTRTIMVPINETVWEPYWEGRFNPFVEPRLAYRPMIRTRWEQRNQEIRTPVTKRELVPEKRMVQAPVTTTRMVETEEVHKVVIGVRPANTFSPTAAPTQSLAPNTTAPSTSLAPGGATTSVANRPLFGGSSVMKPQAPADPLGWREGQSSPSVVR